MAASVGPLRLVEGKGSVYSSAPSATPIYQRQGAPSRHDTLARLGISGPISPDAIGSGFDRYKAALEGNGYIDFFLQSAVESTTEIIQVNEVLGNTYVAWFFGRNAPMFTYTGVLLNTQQDRWRTGLQYLYTEVLRGTKLAQRGLLARLQYDTVLVEGALLNLVESLNAVDETQVQFHFQILVKSFIELDPPDLGSKPISVSRNFSTIEFEPLAETQAVADLSPTFMDDTTLADLLVTLPEFSATSVAVANLGWM